MVSDIFNQDEITFREDTHQYFNLKGEEYNSVSSVLARIKTPFDANGISRAMAMKLSKEQGISIDEAQQKVLGEWSYAKDSSLVKGNFVHGGLENYSRFGTVDPKLSKPIAFLGNLFRSYYKFYPEVKLFSHRCRVAGTTDLVLQRQKSKVPVLDFGDYKTNESKGIYFDSISRKDGVIKHYNRYLLPPFDYMEDCNYVIYSLQLSIYAFMAMDSLGIKVGRLFILFIDNSYNVTEIPVPFMYHEAKMLCESNISIKQLDDYRKYPMTPKESYEKPADKAVSSELNITDDWED